MEQTLPKLLRKRATDYPTIASQYTKNADGEFVAQTYADYYQRALDFGAGLLQLGVVRAEHIGLLSDNRKEWAMADMGLLSIGAIDVPRGNDATERDLAYIYSVTDCKVIITENNTQVKKLLALRDKLPLINSIIVFDAVEDAEMASAKERGIAIYQFYDIIEKGKKWREENPFKVEEELEKGAWDDVATIIFTSGTTGEPKGVILTHGNFLTQLDELPERIILNAGEKAICVLPVWHAFERMVEYVILNAGAAVCYSKPMASVLLPDFLKLNPQLIPGVPRVFEAIYDGVMRTMRKTGGATLALFNFFTKSAILFSRIDRTLFAKKATFKKTCKPLLFVALILPWLLLLPIKALGSVLVFKKIHAKLGTGFRGGVSGGGALPPAVDDFFWAIGINIVEGYGLTETAPVISVRPMTKPIFGTVGSPIRGVEARIVDDDGNVLKAGQKGSLQVRGGIVMRGYYKRDDLTAKVIDKDGWFDTGDIGMLTIDGEIVLKGRKKDTIVLRGGENIEPLPIEMRIAESRYVTHAVVLGQDHQGQDQRYLTALIVPNQDELSTFAKNEGIEFKNYSELLTNAEVLKLFDEEIKNLVNAKSGFRLFERINKFALLEKPFEVGKELSAKQEIMRHKVRELYAKQIQELFK